MPGLIESWIASANDPDGGFPLNNLPYGVFSTRGSKPRCCTRLGDMIVDLAALETLELLDAGGSFSGPALNDFMALGPDQWAAIRQRLTGLFGVQAERNQQRRIGEDVLVAIDQCLFHMPFQVSEFTDFYASRHHATNVGTMLRGPENALSPNWLHMPIGYNGRASSVVVSGTPVKRPCGQLKTPDDEQPVFGPSQRLDLELEMGAVVGVASPVGERLCVKQADNMIFGYTLLNDWSARDIQAWEYQPLGPFQAKAFATSVGSWIVTAEALQPFRTSTPPREKPLLDYLKEPEPYLYNIHVEAALVPAASTREMIISRTNYGEMYYSAAQQLAHHASSGCGMNVGDLLGSGTISGRDGSSLGSLLEMTQGGKKPLELPERQMRTFLEDGDEIILRGHAKGDGYRISFGDCSGRIVPAVV